GEVRTYTFKTPSLLKKLYPGLVWDMKIEGRKNLYLTFDDGPIPDVTPWVLEILSEAKVGATFFMVGDNIRKHPQVCQRVIAAGHSVGNHTYNHLNGWKTNTKEYLANIEACKDILSKNHIHSNLFRPPYGKISRDQISQLGDSFKIVMWDYLSGDFDASLSADKIIRKFRKGVQPGSIVVFHDNIKSFDKLKITLPVFLKFFKEQGYHFDTL
ncbi:MAG: polysaccharide deacetylase family protein, partial [Cyclobacteriaceae bacterium]